MIAHAELLKVDRARRAIANARLAVRLLRKPVRLSLAQRAGAWMRTNMLGNVRPLDRNDLFGFIGCVLLVAGVMAGAVAWHAAFGVSP